MAWILTVDENGSYMDVFSFSESSSIRSEECLTDLRVVMCGIHPQAGWSDGHLVESSIMYIWLEIVQS